MPQCDTNAFAANTSDRSLLFSDECETVKALRHRLIELETIWCSGGIEIVAIVNLLLFSMNV